MTYRAALQKRKTFVVAGVIALVAAIGYGGFSLYDRIASADSAAAPELQIQLGDEGTSGPQLPGECTKQLSGWSTAVSNSDADCIQVRFNPDAPAAAAYDHDFRICLNIGQGQSCTPWASQGGGSGNIAVNSNGAISNAAIRVEQGGSLGGETISNVRVGAQLFYSKIGSNTCRGSSGAVWTSGPASGWAFGEQKDDDPGCAQVHLAVTVLEDPPVYDASHMNNSIPQNVGSDEPIAAEVVMQNDGSNLAASWVSDEVVPGTASAVWHRDDGTSRQLPDCSSYEPGPDAGTCTETQVMTSSNFQLKLIGSTLPSLPVTPNKLFAYRKSVNTVYSSQFALQECVVSPADPPPPGDFLINFLMPQRAYADFLPIDGGEDPACDLGAGGWHLSVRQSTSPHIAPEADATFPVAFNTNDVPAGDYTLTFSMVKLDGSTADQGVRADTTFGRSFTVPLHIEGDPGFGLTCETVPQQVERGRAAQYTVLVTAQNGWTGTTTIAVTGLPPGASSPGGSVSPTDSVIIPVFTSTSTPSGTSTISFNATAVGSTLNASCQSSLYVKPGPRGPLTPRVSLTVSPTSTTPGSAVAISWTVEDTASCTASASPENANWNGLVDATTGTHPPSPLMSSPLMATTTFSIRCASEDGEEVSDSKVVDVNERCETPGGCAPGVAAFAVSPSIFPIYVDGVAHFQAWYDPDGPGISPWQEVTASSTWRSDAPNIAQFAGTPGDFRGIAAGNAPIVASYSGRTAGAQVVVAICAISGGCNPGGATLVVTPPSASVEVGDVTQFQSWYDPDGSGPLAREEVTTLSAWSSEASSIARATSNRGEFEGVAVGEAPIAAAYQGLEAPAEVVVEECDDPDGCDGDGNATLSVSPASVPVQINGLATFRAWYDPDGSGPIARREATASSTWSSDAPTVAQVTSNRGEFRGLTGGTAPIAAAYRGLEAPAEVVVSSCVGPNCALPLDCDFNASPASLFVPPPRSTTLSWSCNQPTACIVRVHDTPRAGTQVGAGGQQGNGTDRPPYTTTYQLSCGNGAFTAEKKVRVFDVSTRTEILPR